MLFFCNFLVCINLRTGSCIPRRKKPFFVQSMIMLYRRVNGHSEALSITFGVVCLLSLLSDWLGGLAIDRKMISITEES